MKRAVFLLGAFALVVSCSTGPRSLHPVGERVVSSGGGPVAFRLIPSTKNQLVDVRVNGRDAVFMLDTGSNYSVIDPAFAERIGAKKTRTVTGGDMANVRKDIQLYSLDSLAIGGAEVADTPAAGIDLTFLRRQLGVDFDGLVGANVLRLFCTRFDFSANTIRFMTAGSRADGIRLKNVGHEYFQIPVSINGVEGSAIIDTGSGRGSGIAVPYDAMGKFRISPSAIVQSRGGQSAGIYGSTVGGGYVRLAEFRLGDLKLAETVATVNRIANPAITDTVYIGWDFFSQFAITFDGPGGEVVLEPRPGAEFPRDRLTWGVGFEKSEGGEWTVAAVLENSSAEAAGISLGDVVRSIDGLPADSMMDSFFEHRYDDARESVTLTLERTEQGATTERTVELKKRMMFGGY